MSFCIKSLNNFYIDLIKSRYKNVPGKQAVFELVVQWVGYILLSISLILFLISFISFVIVIFSNIILIIKGGATLPEGNNFFESISFQLFFGATIVGLFIYSITCPFIIWKELKKWFIRKLEKGLVRKAKLESKKMIEIGICTSSILASLLIITVVITIKDGIKVVKNNGIYIFENNISDTNMNAIVSASLVILICIAVFILLNKLAEIYNVITEETSFILCTSSKEKVLCRCYLEYDDYYLMFENGTERYIKKSEVKEIRKRNSGSNEDKIIIKVPTKLLISYLKLGWGIIERIIKKGTKKECRGNK